MRTRILIFVIAALISGCESSSQIRRREALNRGLTELLARHEVKPVSPKCGSGPVIKSRGSVPCEFPATAEQISRLERGLNLQAVVPAKAPPGELDELQKHSCHSLGNFNFGEQRNKLRIYKSAMKAPELESSGEMKFEYLVIFHNTRINEACAEVFYTSD